MVEGLTVSAGLLVQRTEVVELVCLRAAAADVAEDGQRLLVVVERFTKLTPSPVDATEIS